MQVEMDRERLHRDDLSEDLDTYPLSALSTTLRTTGYRASETNSIEGAGSHPDRARNANERIPSPFLQSMVQAADRIAQGPVLDLASSLRVENSPNDNRSRSDRRHHRHASLQPSQHWLPDHSEGIEVQREQQGTWHRSYEPVTVQNSPSLPPLTRQSRSTPNDDEGAVHNLGPSSLSELLRQHQANPSNGTVRSDRSLSPINNRESVSQGNQDNVSGRSSEARRSLERALRDYRLARRALRTHNLETNESTIERQGAGRPSWTTEHNLLIESVSTSPEINIASRSDESRRRYAQRESDSSSTDPPATSSVPTVATLRAARLSMLRNTAADDVHLSANVDDVPSSSSSSSNRRTGENSGRQAQRITIIRDVPRRFDLRRDNSSASTLFSPHDGISSGSSNTAVRPNDLNADSRRRLDASLLRSRFRTPKVEETLLRKKAKATMSYLSQLKCATSKGDCAISLARKMGIDSMKESLEKGFVYDLPSRIDELPQPQPSSWLDCGVSWSGEQASGTARLPSPYLPALSSEIPIWAQTAGGRTDDTDRMLSLRARRHRERIRAERLEREQQLQNSGPISGQSWSTFGLPLTGSIEVLADMERHLNDLLEEERALVSDDGWTMPDSLLGRQRTRLAASSSATNEERWPVSVKLHAVDFKKMTVHGTMSASHIPNRDRLNITTNTGQQDGKGDVEPVESFFDGEIIDFRHNEIETIKEKEGYRCGGLSVDVQYWAGLGPFREEVERQKNVIRYEKKMKLETGGHDTESGRAMLDVIQNGTKDTYESVVKSLRDCAMMDESELEREEVERAVDETMIRCLGSTKWMDEKLGREWVLMRWKERSFVTPSPGTSSTSSSTRQARTTSSTFFSSNDPFSWGLTIGGFYYIAMHRQTGKIEGLYYDPGSQPFQRLEMWPVDAQRKPQTKQSSQSSSSSAAISSPKCSTTDINNGNAAGYDDDIVGIRKWFPAIEFH